MNKPIYITTTLPYANSTPHIGHEFEFVIADALVRYYKYNGRNVFFNVGLDEHGLKIQEAAEASGVTPQEYVDKFYEHWENFLQVLHINSYDNFYRTSDDAHHTKVKQFWKNCLENGDIYKKKYTGNYCVGCESFKSDRELEDKVVTGIDPVFGEQEMQTHRFAVCPDHPTTEIKVIEEENYFFRLTKYKEELTKWARESLDFLEPTSKRAEFLGFIENLQDISISRVSDKVSWGVEVPDDPSQTIYVWFDALLNYIFAVGYVPALPGHPHFDEYWRNAEVIQICGPDNLKFQAVIFQGLLASAGIKHTDKLLVHGTILDAQNRKMSKTLGNVVDPVDQVNKYGVDAVRYYTLAGLTTYGNSGWDENRLIELHNSHLADDYGNLVSRVTHLAGKILEKYEDDPNVELDYSLVEHDKWCTGFRNRLEENVKPLWEQHKVSEALNETNLIVKSLNKRINDEKPWEDLRAGWVTILELHYAINEINNLYYPVVPESAGRVKKSLIECKKEITFPKIKNEITA